VTGAGVGGEDGAGAGAGAAGTAGSGGAKVPHPASHRITQQIIQRITRAWVLDINSLQ
jgi:hypothetical protein